VQGGKTITQKKNLYICMYVHQLMIKFLKINGTSIQFERNDDS